MESVGICWNLPESVVVFFLFFLPAKLQLIILNMKIAPSSLAGLTTGIGTYRSAGRAQMPNITGGLTRDEGHRLDIFFLSGRWWQRESSLDAGLLCQMAILVAERFYPIEAFRLLYSAWMLLISAVQNRWIFASHSWKVTFI